MHAAFHPALEPNDPRYWFLMQIGMIIGFFTSLPAKWWLIRKGWKEAMQCARALKRNLTGSLFECAFLQNRKEDRN
jgi:hypothetical protein